MKILAAFISVLSVLCLAVPYWFMSDLEQENDANLLKSKDVLNTQIHSENALLTKWQKEYNDFLAQQAKLKEQQKQANKPAAKQLGQLLTIGDKSYSLLGIFKQNDLRFVLFKLSSGEFKKVPVGEEIEQGVTLASVEQNSVTLQTSEQTKEFKLFKRYTTNAS